MCSRQSNDNIARQYDLKTFFPCYFFKKDFTLALVLKLPGEMPIQSQRTLSFSATQEVSKTLIKNQMNLEVFIQILSTCFAQLSAFGTSLNRNNVPTLKGPQGQLKNLCPF